MQQAETDSPQRQVIFSWLFILVMQLNYKNI